MKSIIFFSLLLFLSTFSYAQYGGYGFVDLAYGTVSEKFVDRASDAFTVPDDIKIGESGFGVGASGLGLYNKFALGGGGGTVLLTATGSSNVSMNVTHGFGSLGYNLSSSDNMLIIASGRVGGFSNTLKFEATDTTGIVFGGTTFPVGENKVKSGSLSFGIQVDILYLDLYDVTGLALGISAYYNAPFKTLIWANGGADVNGVEKASYSLVGVAVKIGFGGMGY